MKGTTCGITFAEESRDSPMPTRTNGRERTGSRGGLPTCRTFWNGTDSSGKSGLRDTVEVGMRLDVSKSSLQGGFCRRFENFRMLSKRSLQRTTGRAQVPCRYWKVIIGKDGVDPRNVVGLSFLRRFLHGRICDLSQLRSRSVR